MKNNYIKLILLRWAAILLYGSSSYAALPIIPLHKEGAESWQIRRLEEIRSSDLLNPNEKLTKWSKALVQLETLGLYRKCPQKDQIVNELRVRIYSTSGYADHFAKQVTESYDIVKQGYAEGKSAGEIIQWYAYNQNSTKAFQVLALLPSAETVRVLGKMLEDDWKYPEYDNPALRESYGEALDCRAMSYLMQLPIANPPTANLLGASERSENVHLWKQWYAEIESGRRTFRFIGDDTQYDLRGPIRRGGGMDTNRTGKRTKISTPGEKQIPEASPMSNQFLPYLIGGLVLLAGLGVYLRGKREHPKKHHSE